MTQMWLWWNKVSKSQILLFWNPFFFLTTEHHLACCNISSFTFFPARKLSDFCSTVHTQNKFKSAHHVTEKRSYAVLRIRWTLSDCTVLCLQAFTFTWVRSWLGCMIFLLNLNCPIVEILRNSWVAEIFHVIYPSKPKESVCWEKMYKKNT